MTDADRLGIEWECEKLSRLFAQRNDTQRWDDVAALFAEDGTFARPSAPDKPIAGRQAITDAFKARPADRIARHFCANTVITVNSADEASGVTYILLFSGKHGEEPKPLVGEYHDRFRRTPEGWRFAERRGKLVF